MAENAPLPKLLDLPVTGKTIAAIEQDADYHPLDGGWDHDGAVTIRFTDGSRLEISGTWHNDDTAGTDVEYVPSGSD